MTKTSLFPCPIKYPDDFEKFYKSYRPTKNASKPDAYKAFLQCRNRLPPIELLIEETECYNGFLMDEERRTKRPVPKLHPATFLRQARYEGFEQDAEATIALRNTLHGHLDAEMAAIAKTWDGSQRPAILALVGQAEFDQWFARTVFIRLAESVEIRCPSVFHRNEMDKRFGQVIRKVFGRDAFLSVAGKEKGPPK